MYDASMLFPTVWLNATSQTAHPASDCSIAQSLNDDRNQWGTASTLSQRSSCASTILDSDPPNIDPSKPIIDCPIPSLGLLGQPQPTQIPRYETVFRGTNALTRRRPSARNLAGNPDSPQAVVFLTSIIDETVGIATSYMHYWAI